MDACMFRPQPKAGLATVSPERASQEVTAMQEGEANFVVPAELIGHPARSAMLLALLDGRALPMSMLAAEAGVAASTASEHLSKLTDGGLLRVRPQGRRR
jgi:DNA-binding transcriptional ArsR family regulator